MKDIRCWTVDKNVDQRDSTDGVIGDQQRLPNAGPCANVLRAEVHPPRRRQGQARDRQRQEGCTADHQQVETPRMVSISAPAGGNLRSK
jgi:hypothetical protein